jgi:hypothetical protein
MTEETDYSTDLNDWCQEIDPLNEDNFYERLKPTGITTHHYHFNIYLRRRMPGKSLQKVRMWKNELPGIEEIALTFGGGEAILDFEVLYGRKSGKNKRGIRKTLRFHESWNERKRKHDENTAF